MEEEWCAVYELELKGNGLKNRSKGLGVQN